MILIVRAADRKFVRDKRSPLATAAQYEENLKMSMGIELLRSKVPVLQRPFRYQGVEIGQEIQKENRSS